MSVIREHDDNGATAVHPAVAFESAGAQREQNGDGSDQRLPQRQRRESAVVERGSWPPESAVEANDVTDRTPLLLNRQQIANGENIDYIDRVSEHTAIAAVCIVDG